jgi:hypothetical protein
MYYVSGVDLRDVTKGEMRTLWRWWREISKLPRERDNGEAN